MKFLTSTLLLTGIASALSLNTTAPPLISVREILTPFEEERIQEWWEKLPPVEFPDKSDMRIEIAWALNKIPTAPTWSRLDVNNSMSSPDFCSYISGLAWLVTMSLEDVDIIDQQDPSVAYADLPQQRGPIPRLIRTMTLWEKFLSVLEIYLWESTPPSREAQMRMAHCYTEYALKTQTWLDAMRLQAPNFDSASRTRCIVYSRLNFLYRAHSDVAMRLFFRDSYSAPVYRSQELLDDKFSKKLPPWWNPSYPSPHLNRPIRWYLTRRETLFKNKHAMFEEARRAWNCTAEGEALGKFDLKTMRKEMLHTQQITVWHDFGDIDHLREFYGEMENYTYSKYTEEVEKMARLGT